ncbi:MAG: hypothetical protein S4CHLAM6_12150 [Chlamydiae bacterium]|nr:hypothetical protein [Chlamydiota bacterium]
MQLASKTVQQSSIEGHHYEIYPQDLNSNNTVFGGRIMEIADMLAAACAKKHSGKTCATLLVDSMRFLSPANRGEILIFSAAVNRAWKTSMEVGIRVVTAETPESDSRKVLSAFFTLVSLDQFNKPTPTHPVTPETNEEKRRFEEAQQRRETRIEMAKIKNEQRRKNGGE